MKRFYLLALGASLACASSGSAPRRDQNLITADEMSSVPGANLYEVIERLRPAFLRSRAPESLDRSTVYAAVYLDGRNYGDITTLRSMIPSQAREIRYYSASEGVSKFGLASPSGVIEVISK